MDKLRKRIFFSGKNAGKEEAARAHQEFYCEGQIVNDRIIKEEPEEVKKKEKETKKSRFFANYNMFF